VLSFVAAVTMLKSAATTTAAGKKQRHSKTLPSLLKYFEGISITVELKTGRMFYGTLSSGDESMSLTLTNVETVTKPVTSNILKNIALQEASKSATTASRFDDPLAGPQDSQEHWQQSSSPMPVSVQHQSPSSTPMLKIVQIRGSTIRYIHFPDNADLSIIVKHGIERERAAAAKYQRGVRKTASGR
jgi:small nuclear ribonucleoprotein (snRNP)-like protein